MKTHIEYLPFPGHLFGYMPALCGRIRPQNYVTYPKSKKDERKQERMRTFFAEKPKKATCATCKKLFAQGYGELVGRRLKGKLDIRR